MDIKGSIAVGNAYAGTTAAPPNGAIIEGNVGIGTFAPNASALLDISSISKGLLIPRVALTATNLPGPIAGPVTSLMVYNTATAGVSPNAVSPGYYYWDGAKWIAFGGSGGTNWSLLGNAGTVDGTNFIGTTDNIPFNIRVNNQKAGRIDNGGMSSTFFGFLAGNANTGNGNSLYGYQSGSANTGGGWNTAMGQYSLNANTTGSQNVAMGASALKSNLTSSDNSAFGAYALQNSTGGNNTALGSQTLLSNTTGINNTAVGTSAGYTNTPANANVTGSLNTFIGYNSGPGTAAQLTNASAIGSNARVTASNALILGNAVNVGIGNTAPSQTLSVGANKFLVDGLNGDVTFTDDQASITFPVPTGASQPMIQMWPSGTTNADRMVISHSAPFPSWGLQYQDVGDKFNFLSSGAPVLTIDLQNQ
ncbi:MAG: hypothetical protein Q8L90_19140, partial [Bacteroidota bacterium]|nr:hypothetical protein [Bacteroidota bacterium]